MRARTSCSTTRSSHGSGSTWPTPSRSAGRPTSPPATRCCQATAACSRRSSPTTRGQHDALCGTSAAAACQAKYGDSAPHGPSPSGRELFTLAAAKHGLTKRDLPPSISFFKGVTVNADGGLNFTGGAGPGKAVDLLAELPLIVLIANVPHPADPRPAYTCGPLRVHAWRSAPTSQEDPRLDASPEARRAYLNTAGYLAARGL